MMLFHSIRNKLPFDGNSWIKSCWKHSTVEKPRNFELIGLTSIIKIWITNQRYTFIYIEQWCIRQKDFPDFMSFCCIFSYFLLLLISPLSCYKIKQQKIIIFFIFFIYFFFRFYGNCLFSEWKSTAKSLNFQNCFYIFCLFVVVEYFVVCHWGAFKITWWYKYYIMFNNIQQLPINILVCLHE